jgi:hypothetical protein
LKIDDVDQAFGRESIVIPYTHRNRYKKG